MDPNCKISQTTLKNIDTSMKTHRLKILSFIYHRYISERGISYDTFINDYK